MSKKVITGLVGALTLGLSATAGAAPTLGVDPMGSSFAAGCSALVAGNCFYGSTFSNATDSGVAVGGFTAPGQTNTFHSQAAVGSVLNQGSSIYTGGLNVGPPATFTYEITQTLVFTDTVTSFTPNGVGGGTVTFGNAAQSTPTQLNIYVDSLADGTKVIRSGSAGAACYGGGTAGTSCTAANDGVLVLSAKVINDISSFTASTSGTGTGSFDLTFQITSFDSRYIDISNLISQGGSGLPIFSENFIGTLSQPVGTGGFVAPATSFDGVSLTAAGNQAFKIDSSFSFGVVPEPDTLALFGIALAGLATFGRRKARK